MDAEDFTPRPYQEALLKIAIKQNTILYLPTGSGKTFVAILLIKHFSKSLEKPYLQGGKRTIFLVNTVPLVKQQGNVLSKLLPFSVGCYTGDDNVDFWNHEKWQIELISNEILVMTAQIFLDMVQHRYIGLNKCNLIIFDECHHAVDDHPMRNIMKNFETVHAKEMPHVLGLTATLLNGNVKKQKIRNEIETLEITYQSKVATVEVISEVLGYSTNPNEVICKFEQKSESNHTIQIKTMLSKLFIFLDDANFDNKSFYIDTSRQLLDDKLNMNKKLANLLSDVIFHLDILGLYGGLKAVTSSIIKLERIKKHAEEQSIYNFITVLLTGLMSVQKYLENIMADQDGYDKIFKYSSDQVITLFKILHEYKLHTESCTSTALCGLIFVQRRTTAKVLYHIIKDLTDLNSEFTFIKPDFVVGFSNNPFNDTREALFVKKCNMMAINRFNNKETNLLVSSSVLEEGVDIQTCTLVVMFDFPMNYRSYIQSKGRARHKNSSYYLMIPHKGINLMKRCETYKETEDYLKEFLVGKNDERSTPSEVDIQNQLYDHLLKPYRVASTNAIATVTSAISLVNRYCNSLPHDKFTEVTPIWYKEKDTFSFKVSVVLEFPTQSSVRDIIKGKFMKTIKDAKRAVALAAVEVLHKKGELNDNLLPKENDVIFSELQVKDLFSHWPVVDETPLDSDHDSYNEKKNTDSIKPGTKKFRRQYVKKCPTVFDDSTQSISSEIYYLHVLQFTPNNLKPELTFCVKELLERIISQHTFAILSRTPLPNICDFPIYLSSGEILVSLKMNLKTIKFSTSELEMINRFHCFMFSDVLKLLKNHFIFNITGGEYSYLVIPVIPSGENYDIDYNTIMNRNKIENVCEPDIEAKRKMVVNKNNYLGSIVFPWYRESTVGYLVCDVCEEQNALSSFPTTEFETFSEYYFKRHGKRIENPSQPLLLVTAISSKLNYLKPRSDSKSAKRKLNEAFENFDEHFIPELCTRISFPSDLWIKIRFLPTILNRIEGMFRARELYISIARESGLSTYYNCTKLEPDEHVLLELKKNDEKLSVDVVDEPSVAGRVSPVTEILDMKTIEFDKILSKVTYPWKVEQEPIDIERNMDNVSILDIEYYERFISQKLTCDDDNVEQNCNKRPTLAITFERIEKEVPIKLLQNDYNNILELREFYQALIAASANDIVNFERFETIGDSFLKFSSSLYLFLQFPDLDEGKLTMIKGKIVGNRNLLYCARLKNLGSYMKVTDLSPNYDFIPPSFTLPHPILNLSDKLPRSSLYLLNISKEEQYTGVLTEISEEHIENFLSQNITETPLSDNSVKSIVSQTISDKSVADCVEAIIGCILCSNGLKSAFSILGWFGILPNNKLDNLLNGPVPSPLMDPKKTISDVLTDVEFHLSCPEKLEQILGYKFKNRGYLLQALSHASYNANKLTLCYQRLEFVGDAILDFLITCHIYERCGNLSPGELTDLRSALVNNVVFASLVVKHGFHKFMLSLNPTLSTAIEKFVQHQEDNDFSINDNVLILLVENDYNLASYVDVPKALGDIFESLAGAVFFDSGMKLEVVWEVFYKLMRPLIEEFSSNVPKNIVRKLYEETQACPKFCMPETLDDGTIMVGVTFLMDGRKIKAHGFGENKKQAKIAAAKIALRALTTSEKIAARV